MFSYLLAAFPVFPALCFCICPVLRFFQDSSGGLTMSHTRIQRTGLVQTDNWGNQVTEALGECSVLKEGE